MLTDNDAPEPDLAEAIRELRDSPPERDLWPMIHAELPPRIRRGFVQVRWPIAVAAGLTLIAASVGGTAAWLTREPALGRSSAPADTGEGLLLTVAGGGANYAAIERAIADLDAALQANVESFEPGTYHGIAKSLALLDHAIADAAARERKAPDDPQVERYLASALQRKLDVLRTVTQLTTTRS